ncbi:unnamed protein product [Strongylus vulgaris]|uniref:Uncharacterized protein n=1 Tax=Strongylus vulgaris TaxID=40348 RepID=A0A3P7KRE7_STRVU|nr:unnamed protein product [Strongylus vulgaris]
MRKKPFSAEERLIKWTNFAIANGVLKELHVQGSRLNFIVYFNIDVITAIVAVLFIFVLVLIELCLGEVDIVSYLNDHPVTINARGDLHYLH